MTLRTLLVLGRVSNLPTVWSNLLVGWAISDIRPREGMWAENYHGPDATAWPLLHLLLGGSFLYIGGMYLNDYCDAAFDARFRANRPLPSGKISRRVVGLLALLWFVSGLAFFTAFGPATVAFALLLVTSIFAYDFHHKDVAWAPLLMGFCRCLLYLLAASAVMESWHFDPPYGTWWDHALTYIFQGDCWINAWSTIRHLLPSALPLGLYVAGVTYLARGESRPSNAKRWPYLLPLLTAAMILIANDSIVIARTHWLLVQNPHEYLLLLVHLLAPCVFLPCWMGWLLVPFWRRTKPSIGRVVSGLLAGIVLLDMIVVAPQVGLYAVMLLPFFLLALLLQRFVPAT